MASTYSSKNVIETLFQIAYNEQRNEEIWLVNFDNQLTFRYQRFFAILTDLLGTFVRL